MIYTTSDLITTIKDRGQIPDSTNTSTLSSPARLLSLATDEMRLKIVPMVLDVAKEYYVRTLDIAVVASTAGYALPTRAAGNVIRSIRLVNGTTDMPFQALEPDRLPTTGSGTPFGYYFQDNQIILYPTPAASGPTIRIGYFHRPSRLEQIANCAQISTVTSASNQITTVSTPPSTWGAGTVVDFIASVNPYVCRAIDQTILSVSGSTIIFTASLPSDLIANDYVALAEYSCLPQIPEELQPLLAQMTVVKYLEATGAMAQYQAALADLKEGLKSAKSLLTPRDQSHPEKIVGGNWLRAGWRARGFLR